MILPLGVLGKVVWKSTASCPAKVMATAWSKGRRLGVIPCKRASSRANASSMSSVSLAWKAGSVNPKRLARRRKMSVFGRASPTGGMTASARCRKWCPYAG